MVQNRERPANRPGVNVVAQLNVLSEVQNSTTTDHKAVATPATPPPSAYRFSYCHPCLASAARVGDVRCLKEART